jgi:hypothetical protein
MFGRKRWARLNERLDGIEKSQGRIETALKAYTPEQMGRLFASLEQHCNELKTATDSLKATVAQHKL